MGRWAQRRRTGGGPAAIGALNQIVDAQITATDEIQLTYASDITGAGLLAPDFQSLPSGALGDSAVITPPTTLTITMDGTVAGDTSVTYSGPEPGFLSPQTIAY